MMDPDQQYRIEKKRFEERKKSKIKTIKLNGELLLSSFS